MSSFFQRLARAFRGPPSLSAEEARQLPKGDVVFLDVREAAERRRGHIPGSKHVPLRDIPSELGRLDRDKTYVVYCASGMRSARAARELSSAGFERVYNLRGGFHAWR